MKFLISGHFEVVYDADDDQTTRDVLTWLEENANLMIRPGKDVDEVKLSGTYIQHPITPEDHYYMAVGTVTH